MTDKLIQTISAAVAPGATEAQKRAGAAACQTLGSVLGAAHGQPMAPVALPPAAAPSPAAAGLVGMNVLDAVIAKLKANLPETADATAAPADDVPPLRIPFIPLPGINQ